MSQIEFPNHLPVNKGECNQGGQGMADLYKKYYFERLERYSVPPLPKNDASVLAVNDLRQKGYTVMKNAIEKEKIAKLKEEFETLILNEENRGKDNEYFIQIRQPLLCSKQALDVAFSPLVREVSTLFYGATPAIGTMNFRRSLVNDLNQHNFNNYGNLFFHYDNNSPWFLKFFFYLNDVSVDGGPFVYVEGSHRQKIVNWERSKRYSDENIKELYGEDRIKYLTANVGDVVIANTRGIHKGLKTKNDPRTMLTVNVVIHPEISNQRWNKIHEDKGRFYIKKEWYDQLSDEEKPFADYLLQK